MNNSGQGCISSVSGLLTSLALFALALSVLLMIVFFFLAAVALFLLLRLVFRRVVLPQFYPATAVFAEQRLFGAPPDSQLFSAFDYWLLCLEKATGLPFTQTPGQLFVGSILIALAPALVIGLPLAAVSPDGDSVLWGLVLFGIGFGGFTGYRLGQPAQGWFQALGGGRDARNDDSQDGFRLGDEEW